jgi:hypothetical protein
MGASGAARGGLVGVNVRTYGAKGNGTTLDTAAINAAIQAGAGGTVVVPAGPLGASVYLIDATTGIKLNRAGTTLALDEGATIKVATNAADSYMAIEVTAADCVITGGTILGDVDTHTGTTGEWGHLIVANGGSDRLLIRSVTVANAWGDGITIQNNPADVSVLDVTADSNRRQGMSITAAVRPRVLGGVYKNTGRIKATAPTAGIDVEPNAGGLVADAQIVGVTFSNNTGPGLQVASVSTSTAEVTITACRSIDSSSTGFYFVGPSGTIRAKAVACWSEGNALHGYMVNTDNVELAACTARGNTQHGIQVNSSFATLSNPVSYENGRHGIQIAAGDSCSIANGSTTANSQSSSGGYVNVDQWGTNTRITGHVSKAGTLTAKPAWGFLIRAASTGRVIDCDSTGAYTAGAWSDGSGAGNTVAFPVPGSAKPNPTGSRGGNAALASLLTGLASMGLITDGTSA